MINQEKVKDMTKMAVYESHGGDKELSVSAYRRKDYVALHLLLSFILGTISYVIILTVYIMSHLDIVDNLNTIENITHFGMIVGAIYVVFIVAFLVITFVWARKRHKRCKDRASDYCKELNRVARSYGAEDGEE